MNNKFVIRKVPVAAMLQQLTEIFNNNIEFVNVEGKLGKTRDFLTFDICEEPLPSLDVKDIMNDLIV